QCRLDSWVSELKGGWSGVSVVGVVGVFDAVGAVAMPFDGTGAGAVPSGVVGAFDYLGKCPGQGSGHAIRGKMPLGR
ncbi:hypothetical protein, partial [Streptomyces sp. NPDC003952]